MAKYRVLEKSYINGALAEEGDEVEYEGEVAGNLELIKGSKRAAKVVQDEPAEGGEALV